MLKTRSLRKRYSFMTDFDPASTDEGTSGTVEFRDGLYELSHLMRVVLFIFSQGIKKNLFGLN